MTDPKRCSVKDCAAVAVKRGLCESHYQRLRKHGDLKLHYYRRPPTVHPDEVYGRLTVISEDGYKRHDRAYRCRCTCGKELTVVGYALKGGNTRSCGCLKQEINGSWYLTHGETAKSASMSPTYHTWRGMIDRCSKRGHEYYADRGITVAPEWQGRDGYLQFRADMGERPEGKTLDRIDPNGNYEPGNCRWATRLEQARNKRKPARLSRIAELERLIKEQAAELARLRE